MKPMPTWITRSALWALPLVMMVAPGCSRNKTASGLDAALVSGADVVARLNVESIRSSPIVQALKGGADPSAPVGFWQPFWNSTGLTQDDVSGVIVSVDLDNLDLANPPSDSQLETLQAIMAFELKKELTLDQLKAGIAAMDTTGRSAPTEIMIEDVPALKSNEGGVICLQGAGRFVFVAPNETCLGAALQRFKKGKVEALSPAMTAAFKALPGEPQIRAVLVLTEALQAKLKADFEAQKQNPSPDLGVGMMMGMLGPMVEVKSLGLSVACTSDFNFNLGSVFTTMEAAAQMKATADMALGMLMMAAQQKSAGQPSSLAQSISVTQSEKLLNISLTLTESDMALIKSLQPTTGVQP